MRRTLSAAVVLTGLAALASCQNSNPAPGGDRAGNPGVAPSPSAPSTTTAGANADAWRPQWWIATPVRDSGGGKGATVAAFGTDPDLLASRRKAVDAASKQLAELLGSAPDAPATKADTIRLPGGEYRTFVLVSVPGPNGS